MLNWRQRTQKYKGRAVLRGDLVKNNSGSYAVFTEQGSSASQMTAANIMDIISRYAWLRWTNSRRSVGLHPSENGRCSQIIENSKKSECPDIWIRLPRHKWPKPWSSMEDPVVLRGRNLYGHFLAGLLWKFKKILLKHG